MQRPTPIDLHLHVMLSCILRILNCLQFYVTFCVMVKLKLGLVLKLAFNVLHQSICSDLFLTVFHMLLKFNLPDTCQLYAATNVKSD